MTALQPLLARDRYTDEEWALASDGRCSWNWNKPVSRELEYCGARSDPESAYRFCNAHDTEIRIAYGTDYGM